MKTDAEPLCLEADSLTLGYPGRTVINALSFAIPAGQVTALVGPNACGKSTLLRGLARLLPPQRGAVLLEGQNIHAQSTRSVARRLCLLPQHGEAPEGLTVRELAEFGRHPHRNWLGASTPKDDQIVAEALADVGLSALADSLVEELSGGQKQRVWLAMALAQQAEVLLLDEPTTFLDPAHQFEVLHLIRELNTKHGRTIVMVLHDLNLAARFADRVVLMKDGALVAHGRAAEVLTPTWIQTVYGIRAEVRIEDDGVPLIVFRG